MKKLNKEKQQQLILVGMVTLLVLAGLWFGVVNAQKARLKELSLALAKAQQKLTNMQRAISSADQVEAELKVGSKKLGEIEDGMASGDLYSWFVVKMREFQAGYKVNVAQTVMDAPGEVKLLANFPYKQCTFIARGTGYYNDIGRFVADFENHFPFMQIQNLELQPNLTTGAQEDEKLAFKMEIITLVKPTG